MNTNNEIPANSVNERGIQHSQLSLSNEPVMNQACRGRHPVTRATLRKNYTRENNRAKLKFYYKSNAEILATANECGSYERN